MSNITPRLHSVFAEAFDKIRKGELKTLIPFLSLFRFNGKPLNLNLHYQFAPVFNCVQPVHTCIMTARQVGKSWAIAEDAHIRSSLIPGYHNMIIQPRADQIQRFNATVFQPLMRSSLIQSSLITNMELSKLALKTYNNGSLVYLDSMYLNADRIRGASGLSSTTYDESISEDTHILCLDLSTKSGFISKKVSEIRKGDACISFAYDRHDAIVSIASRDASFHGYRDCFEVETVSGRKFTCTADHMVPTDNGKMRISEVIEHEFTRRSACNQHVGTAVECDFRKLDGGWLSKTVGQHDKGNALEPWGMSNGLCPAQVPNIIRVRHKASVIDAESRLREQLGSLNTEEPWHTSLYICADTSGWLSEENDNTRVSRSDNSSDSSGVVVHGRWMQTEIREQRYDIHQRIFTGRERADIHVDGSALGNRNVSNTGKTLLDRQSILATVNSNTFVCSVCDTNTGIHSGLHEIQNRDYNAHVHSVQETISGYRSQFMLFRGMCSSTQCRGKSSVLRRKQRTFKSTVESMGERTSWADKCCSPLEIQQTDARAERSVERLLQKVARKKQGQDSCKAQSLEGCPQTRSLVQSEKAARGSRNVRAIETRSRAIPGTSGQSSRAAETGQLQGEGPGVSTQTEIGKAHAESRKISGIFRSQTASGGPEEHDTRRAPSTRQCTIQRALSQIKGSDVSGRMGCQKCQNKRKSTQTYGSLESRPNKVRTVQSGEQTQGRGEESQEKIATFLYDPIKRIVPVGRLRVYDIEVEGTHNYVLANGICSYNCQDLEMDNIRIANETMSASIFWGFSRYTGTPKTTDTTLALLWNRSSQAEWVIRCTHCGYFNVPSIEHDLMKMIGKEGPICAKCGKRISPADGGYVHAFPDRALSFAGYHISQTIHPLHTSSINKWMRLLDKVNNYEPLILHNEVLGVPYDAATSPLTMSDMQKATHDISELKRPRDIEKIADQYSYITVGVDWGGGGAISDSYTSYAVLGMRASSDVIDVLYGRRIPKGVSPMDEVHEILDWIQGTGADAFAFDNGGAGFARLEMMKQAGLMSIPNLTVVPMNYVAPHSGDVMKLNTAQREPDMYYYTLDKSRSLAICLTAIKSVRLRFPKFSEEDEKAYQRDFLALREDPSKSVRNETVILIVKKPGVPDDFAHAVNFGCSQIWDHFGAYPRIGSRYDTSILDFDENNNRIMKDEDFGPRGDFERFRDAVESRAAIIEGDDPYDYFG